LIRKRQKTRTKGRPQVDKDWFTIGNKKKDNISSKMPTPAVIGHVLKYILGRFFPLRCFNCTYRIAE
jgi:hypothetical protein